MAEEVTVYHHPDCSKSRRVCELLQEQGQSFESFLYLETPPNKEQLQRLMQWLGIEDPRQMMRPKEAQYAELKLDSAGSDALLEALVTHPQLLERPILLRAGHAIIARPPELALDFLA